jgi:hypothetical protein
VISVASPQIPFVSCSLNPLYYIENRFEYVIKEVKYEIKILWLKGSAVVENGMHTVESR